MTQWGLLLHFYQPPTQTHEVLVKVANESYRPLLKVLHGRPGARVAVNVQGVLTELLLEHGLGDIVDSLKALAERGTIEFVGSGKFHPILPLIPERLRGQAIATNAATNSGAFGQAWAPRGFFPPEMCFSSDIVPGLAESGHDWVIVSGVACPLEWPTDRIHRVAVDGQRLSVLFRDDVRSNDISFRRTNPEDFVRNLARVGGNSDAYVITAMDAETFGHHIANWETEFLDGALALLAQKSKKTTNRVEMALPSAIVDAFPAGEVLTPRPSSWSTSDEDIAADNPFPLWNSPGNAVHAAQWEYVDHCLFLESAAREYANTPEAHKFAAIATEKLDPALHSCQFWWASRRPMWDFSMIHRGFMLLSEVVLNASRSLVLGSPPDTIRREARWRAAAANELRDAIERELVGEAAL
ncbi:MAG: hypothetical protein ABI577_07700 [bacterium]